MSERREPLAGDELERFTRRLRRQMKLIQRVAHKRKSLLDRLVTKVLERATRPKKPEDDFMRDEICDAEIGFSVEELEAYERGEAPPPPA